jgi:hypothetical protein
LGEVDEDRGEFWVTNPFQMPQAGHNLSAYERKRLFVNIEGEGFLDASRFSNADIDSDTRSVIAADFDRDGRTDLLVGSVGGGPLRLFLNRVPSENRHRVQIELVGVESNRPAIGSHVRVECGRRQIHRDVFAANGFAGQAPPELLVGVGAAERIEKISIRWPTGKTQEFRDLPVDVRITITEGATKFTTGAITPR